MTYGGANANENADKLVVRYTSRHKQSPLQDKLTKEMRSYRNASLLFHGSSRPVLVDRDAATS